MKGLLSCTCGSSKREEVIALLRVITGFVFLYHGYGKIFGMGMEQTIGFFASVGIPAANVLAYLVAYGELLGGIALIVGFMTHWVSKLNVLIMLGAIYFVHMANGYNVMSGGFEYPLMILVVNLFFMVNGAGKWSIDKKCDDKVTTA